MRDQLPERLEAARVRTGPYASDRTWGAYGLFELMGPCGAKLKIIASGAAPDDDMADGWEHVSVSTRKRTPNWTEMCWVKDLFWTEEEMVVQYHPPKSDYVNNHPYCLHLWRHKTQAFPAPPTRLVGLLGVGEVRE